MHWCVYHSRKRMGHEYQSTGESAVYSTKEQPKLCFNDTIWVVEGDESHPVNYTLVDCFQYTDAQYPPFTREFQAFKIKITGSESLLPAPVPLSREVAWFDRLHGRFLSRQKLFSWLKDEEEIVAGLQEALKNGAP